MDTSQHRELEVSPNIEGLNLLTIKDAAKMRKDNEQQKKTTCEQLKLFTRKGEPVDGKAGGTSNATETGAELSSRLEQQRALTENILERIVDYRNIDKAYRQVKFNDGSSGIDGMEVEELRQWLGGHLKEM
jgi:hypothetical protein